MNTPGGELELLAQRLEQTGDFRVLRRLQPRDRYHEAGGGEEHVGLIVDTESTGPEALQDKLIEIAIIRFRFTADGRITDVIDRHSWLQDPEEPLTDEIKTITGLNDELLRGKVIDAVRVDELVKSGVLCVAHNAAFDRKLLERYFPVFADMRWGCSMAGVNWDLEGVSGRKLGYILTALGFFHSAHRAIHDCEAVLHVLGNPLPVSGMPGLFPVLENARRRCGRLYAENAPFEFKDTLKARGYRWNAEAQQGKPKAWYIDLDGDLIAAEQQWLSTNIFGGRGINLPLQWITAKDRFSVRA